MGMVQLAGKEAGWVVDSYDIDSCQTIQKPYDNIHGTPYCSNCRWFALFNGFEYITSDYCPHCGSVMRKEVCV